MEWIKAENHPYDCRRYATRSMHIISNDGFVTIGFWYPETEIWTSSSGTDITSQVTHWMDLPKAPQ